MKASKAQLRAPQSAERLLAQLRADHGGYSQLLLLLSRERSRLAAAPRRTLPLVREALTFVTLYLDVYHHPYEDALYELIARRARKHARLLSQLKEDHKHAALISARMIKVIDGMGARGTAARLAALGEDIDRFVDLSRRHIGDEEQLMYSRAAEALSEADWQVILATAPADVRVGSHRLVAGDSYPLLKQYFRNNARHVMRGDSAGLLERIGLHEAGAACGNFVGRSVEASVLAARQNREAVGLALASARALFTPRSPTSYAGAVKTAYRRDTATITRWIREWKEQIHYGPAARA